MRHISKRLGIAFFVMVLLSQLCLAVGLGTFETELRYTPGQTTTLTYYIVKAKAAHPTVNFEFSGSLEPYVTVRMNHFWYSTRLDELNLYLKREFDLSSVSSATLQFYTKYDIEHGWDFGYVEVSTNNGSTWTQLSGTGTTIFRDGGAYVGIPGAPAYTGTVSDWTLETVNLTPYVGGNILLRFRYVTDSYYSEDGWRIDDISISEIGFSDDVESGDNGWSTNGWVSNVRYLNESSKTVPVYLDFNIPDSYVYNNTEEILIVSTIPGADGDFNPSQSSVERVRIRIPGLVKVNPPAPSGGGGGGGGSAFGGSYTIKDGILTYFAGRIAQNSVTSISTKKSDSPVQSISLKLDTSLNNCVISITPHLGKPDIIKQDIEDVYSYFSIDSNIPDSNISEAIIRVAVSKDWLESKDAGPEDVVISRFSGGKWTDLPTELVDEGRTDYFYHAITPGFSVFAVRLKGSIEPPMIITPVPTPKPKAEDIKPLTIVAGNRSIEEVVKEINETLKKKIGYEEPAASAPLQEAPAAPCRKDRTRYIIGSIFAIVVIALVLLKIMHGRKLPEKKQHMKKSVKRKRR